MALVSICIPAYRQTLYLEKCLKSIQMQDFQDYEVIISDDSPDDTVKNFLLANFGTMVYSYSANTPSLGSPENWNHAIRKANGKYIKIMHHDDCFTGPSALRLMVEEMERSGADFLFCQTDIWHLKTSHQRINAVSDKQWKLIQSFPDFLFFRNLIGSPSATMFRSGEGLLFDNRFKWLVDVEFYLRLFKKGAKVTRLNRPLIRTFHQAEGQVTGDVENDPQVLIREHVLLFNTIAENKHSIKKFETFFDLLFFRFSVTELGTLEKIVPEMAAKRDFYAKVIKQLPLKRKWKNLRARFYNSYFNTYYLKLEQFA